MGFVERSLSQKIEFVWSEFERHGVTVTPGCRLDQIRRVFLDDGSKLQRFVTPDDPGFRLAQEALRDFYLLERILESVDRIELQIDAGSLLKRLLKGETVPQSSSPASIGRDLQAELLTATICVRGGMSEVALADPDVQATIGTMRWGVAVKRPKNADRLDDNLRDAARQVEAAGIRGVILLDISLAFNQMSTPLLAPSAEEFDAALARRLRAIIKDNEDVIMGRARAKGVGLVCVFDSQIRQVPKGGWGLASMHMIVDVDSSATAHKYRQFRRRFSEGARRLPLPSERA